MRLSLLFSFCLCFFQSVTVFGQWELIKPNQPTVAPNQFLKGDKNNLVQIWDNTVAWSKDKGKTWTANYLPNNLPIENCEVTSKGIYAFSIVKENTKYAFMFSPNFGRTWQTQIIKDSFYLQGKTRFYSDSNYMYSILTQFIYVNPNTSSHTRVFKAKLGENNWVEDSTETFKRVDTTYRALIGIDSSRRDSSRFIYALRDTTFYNRTITYLAAIDNQKIIYIQPDSLIVIDRQDSRKTRRIKTSLGKPTLFFNDSLFIAAYDWFGEVSLLDLSKNDPDNGKRLRTYGSISRLLIAPNKLYQHSIDRIDPNKKSIDVIGFRDTFYMENFSEPTDLNRKFRNRGIITLATQDSFLFVLTQGSFVYRLKKGETKWTFCYMIHPAPDSINSKFFKLDVQKLANNIWVKKTSFYRNLVYGSSTADELIYSLDSGKIWQPFEYPAKEFGGLYPSYLINKNDVYAYDRGGYTPNNINTFKSSNFGSTWQAVDSFGVFTRGFSVQDTIFRIDDFNSLVYYALPPYKNWETLLYFYETLIVDQGIFYYKNRIGNNFTVIDRMKFDGTALTPIQLPSDWNNCSFFIDRGNMFSYDFRFDFFRHTPDNGSTWNSIFKIPNTNIGRSLVKVLSNGLFMISIEADNTCCKNYNKFGGIYVSKDKGSSWVQANDNLFFYEPTPTLNTLRSGVLTEIDGYVYYDRWRRKIDDFKFKSAAGITYNDKNNNGQRDAGEPIFSAIPIISKNAGNYTQSDSLGLYNLFIDTKTSDTLRALSNNKYSKINPPFRLLNEIDTTITNQNFGIYLFPNVVDLSVNLTSVAPTRSGFKNDYILTYKNEGSTIENGDITLSYNTMQIYNTASPAPVSNVNQLLTWRYTNLEPNETRSIQVTFQTQVNAPIGFKIQTVARITPLTKDTAKNNNVDSLTQFVVNAYDPNDKQVSFANRETPPAVIDTTTELIYTIRFQNTGNYPASFVKITDTLNDKLDFNSLRVIASSHKYDVSVRDKKILVFDFNPIYLPDSSTNEQASHGFVKFGIRPNKTLTKDDIIKNTAFIFFDYNSAIVTNTVETANQKRNKLLALNNAETLTVYPNPAQNFVSFKTEKFNGEKVAINVYAIDGRLMFSKHITLQSDNILSTETLHEGMYIIQFSIGDKQFISKFIIEK
jgi:uncharacterized repeat protein (TIGR01451 family)